MNEIINITYFDVSLLLFVLMCILVVQIMLNQYIKSMKKSLRTAKENIKFLNKQRLDLDFKLYKFSTIAALNESRVKEIKASLKREIFLTHSASCSATLDILIVDFIKKASKKELEELYARYDDGKHPLIMGMLLGYAPKEDKSSPKKKVTKKKATKKKVTRKKKS